MPRTANGVTKHPTSLGFIFAMLLLVAGAVPGQTQTVTTRVLTLEAAKRVATAAEAEAERNGWNVAISIVDPAGGLILFHRRDGTQPGSLDIATGKARTAARLRRPTKALEDAIVGGRTSLLALGDLLPVEGGVPIILEGELVAAIGVSGVTSQQDAQIAEAGIAVLSR
jgi:glc operon protein GlcG